VLNTHALSQLTPQSIPKPTNELFQATILDCIYERVSCSATWLYSPAHPQKYSQSHEHATEEELLALQYREPTSDGARVEESSTTAAADAVAGEGELEVEDPFKGVPILHRAPAEIYLFDTQADVFVIQEREVWIELASNGDFDSGSCPQYILRALTSSLDHCPQRRLGIHVAAYRRRDDAALRYGELQMDRLLDAADPQNNYAFMFAMRQEGLAPNTWCFKFTADVFAEFKEKFTIYLWEGKNRQHFAKVKADEQRYIQDAYQDEDVDMDADPGVAVQEEEAEEEEPVEEVSESESADEGEDEDEDMSDQFARGARNEQLAVGYKNDLSYVTRGDMIGVFAPKDDKLRFRTTIDRVKDNKGKGFTPGKVSGQGGWCRSLTSRD
jgi:hypothetical protein